MDWEGSLGEGERVVKEKEAEGEVVEVMEAKVEGDWEEGMVQDSEEGMVEVEVVMAWDCIEVLAMMDMCFDLE